MTSIQELMKKLGNPTLPSSITQEPLDFDNSHYIRLCNIDTKPSYIDLYSYCDDLLYREIQKDLCLFLLPVCLSVWEENFLLSSESNYDGFMEQFSSVLARHSGLKSVLSSSQYLVVSKFIQDTILQQIDRETNLTFSGSNASPYKWIYEIGTFGTAFPTIKYLWKDWWSCTTKGRACAVLQYASMFMYNNEENPIFSPWTCAHGGGAPIPWETSGNIYDETWLLENIEFLRTTFTTDYIYKAIISANNILKDTENSSISKLILSDFSNSITLVELRIEEFIQNISSPLSNNIEWLITK